MTTYASPLTREARLQLADIASMAPGIAEEKGREARDYHRLLSEGSDR